MGGNCRKLNARPAWFEKKAVANLYQFAKRHDMQVDHIVPLSHKYVCGLHCFDNLQVLTGKRNSNKRNNWWPQSWHEQFKIIDGWSDPIQMELKI